MKSGLKLSRPVALFRFGEPSKEHWEIICRRVSTWDDIEVLLSCSTALQGGVAATRRSQVVVG